MHFLLHIILSALDNIQKTCIVLILFSGIAYTANNLGFSSNLISKYISCFVSCRKLYYLVVYLYVNGSGSITSVGEERANLSAVIYL